ncbi:MAG: hypothetical protein ACK5KT_01045 [Dysgonomonas sp.]
MTDLTENIPLGSDTYQCAHCGAAMKYQPGTTFLHCDYCNSDTIIDAKPVDIVQELDFEQYARSFEKLNTKNSKIISCRKCGAESTFYENMKSVACPYCTSPLVESDAHEERLIQPSYLLPFKVSEKDILNCVGVWLKGLWFAPNKLKKRALLTNKLQGIYIPCWTYDAQTNTDYTGQRGVNYTTTVGSGKNKQTVVRTRWTYCSGRISLFFDDIMVPASRMVASGVMKKIENWDTKNMVETDNRFLSGFVTEKYVVNMDAGYETAKQIMESHIDYAIRQDIGGDHQRVDSKKTSYNNVKFKLILLPIYVSSYTYRNKLYHFFVNGRTGQITGDRPYSIIKIVLAVIAGLILIAAFIMYMKNP